MLILTVDLEQKYKKGDIELPMIQLNLKDFRTVQFVTFLINATLLLS